MQFKHPELLYALLLLIIPIIIHLFQLRRFQKVEFTNVQFLKQISLQTRKSSQLKKWLILLMRLLLLAAIIFAFSQPYLSKFNSKTTNFETVIYLDNSFSMQAKGDKGALLKRAVQDIISNVDENEKITLFTNDIVFKNTRIKTIKNELLQLNYSSNQLDYNAVVLKGKTFFSNELGSVKNLLLLSDFQQKEEKFTSTPDAFSHLKLVQLDPANINNISIDSAYISKTNASNIELTVVIKYQGELFKDLPISLFNNERLIAKTTINSEQTKASFTLPHATEINGKISIEDDNLQFDNVLYFNLNKRPKTNVLFINAVDDDFLKRIFTKDEFNYKSVAFNELNYNDIEAQNLIVLNELESFSTALINALKTFTSRGGYILIIPSKNILIDSYNQLLNNFNATAIETLNTTEKKITTINYSHPLFAEVFDKKVSNFQYPKVSSFYNLSSGNGSILQFEDGKPFLIQSGRAFIFASALNTKNSNFTNSPLIVPTLYNIGRQSLKLPKLYYTIGFENNFDVNITMQQDDILKLKTNSVEIIPQQRTFSNKVAVTTNETPKIAAIYTIANKTKVIEHISYNYNRSESDLSYMELTRIKHASIHDSIPQVLNTIKSDANSDELWKWFVIFALFFLIIEMLILKYFK